MSEKLQRWHLYPDWDVCGGETDCEGEWVKAKDVSKLEAENERLRTALFVETGVWEEKKEQP